MFGNPLLQITNGLCCSYSICDVDQVLFYMYDYSDYDSCVIKTDSAGYRHKQHPLDTEL